MATVTLETSKLKQMVSRVTKCATSSNSLNALGGVIEVKMKDGKFSLRSTDSQNTMIVRETEAQCTGEGDGIQVVIDAENFVKVVNGSTTKETTFNIIRRISKDKATNEVIEDYCLVMKSNGTYKFKIILEGSTFLMLEDIPKIEDADYEVKISVVEMQKLINKTFSFLGSTFEDPRLDSYYFGNKTAVTNGTVVCFNDTKLTPEPLMLRGTTVRLLSQFDASSSEKITLAKKGTHVQFYNSSMMIDTSIHQLSGQYPIKALSQYLDADYASKVTVDSHYLKEALSRIQIFVDTQTESGAFIFEIKQDGLHLSSRNGMAYEVVPFDTSQSPQNYKDFSLLLAAPELMRIIDMPERKSVVITYGNEDAIMADFGEDKRVLGVVDEADLEPLTNDDDESEEFEYNGNGVDDLIADEQFSAPTFDSPTSSSSLYYGDNPLQPSTSGIDYSQTSSADGWEQ